MEDVYAQRGGVHVAPGGYATRISDYDRVNKLEQEFEDGVMSGWPVMLRRIIADDCNFVDDRGTVRSKSEVVHDAGLHDRTAIQGEFQDVHVRLLRKAGIATGRVFMRIYLKRKGHWQLVAGQETRIEE